MTEQRSPFPSGDDDRQDHTHPDSISLTHHLAAMAGGDRGAADIAFPIVYEELRTLAKQYLRNERIAHTLQPTALVNEAYLRLAGSDANSTPIDSRNHFFARFRLRGVWRMSLSAPTSQMKQSSCSSEHLVTSRQTTTAVRRLKASLISCEHAARTSPSEWCSHGINVQKPPDCMTLHVAT
ncbi:MAG: ECF-type sigma factor [Phycisphaerales bacterium]